MRPVWGLDGLYLINENLTDSTYFAPKPYDHILLPPAISPDHKWYVHGGTMYHIPDSEYIVIDTLLTEFPEGMIAADFLHSSFNPILPEVLFNLIYFNDDDEEISRVGV
ncbi:MAG: hypothetical protein P1R58_02815 [bacterium]|nr:hypothetical protein [bacterium]